jgi:hypothetical protein
METLLKKGDCFENREVTRVTDKFCFFNNKRIGWNKIQQSIDKGSIIQFKRSPNTDIDWSVLSEVENYYNSFIEWDLYISNGDKGIDEVIEVKNGLVFYNGEFYLPAPYGFVKKFKDSEIKDGLYNVRLFKKLNCWYSTMKNEKTSIVNVFLQLSEVKTISDIKQLENNSEEIYAYKYDSSITFSYTQSFIDGVTIDNISIDLIRFFKNFYVNKRWRNEGIRILLNDFEISDILNPIKNEIENILHFCKINKSFHIETSESYGEVSIDYLILEKSICTQIFDLVNKRLKEF